MTFVICLLLLCDTGRPTPTMRVEKLGGRWTPLDSTNDRGLSLQRYRNETLNRDESWHQAESGEWFLRVKDGMYVLAVPTEPGLWETRPSVRLVLLDGVWKRVSK